MIKAPQLNDQGVRRGHFWHNRALKGGMKFLQSEIIATQTSFSTYFGGKLSFILAFLSPECGHCSDLYFHCSYVHNCYNNYS